MSRGAVEGWQRAVAGITWRLTRRSTLALALGMAVYIPLEGLAFTKGYPTEAARHALTLWGEDPSIRIIAGPAIAVESVGGFIMWDAGLYFTLILGAWALTTSTRVLRGDEAAGRTDLLLQGPMRPTRVLLTQCAVLLALCLGIGIVFTAAFIAAGAQAEGAVVIGAGVACYLAVLMGLGVLASQWFPTRGAALAACGATLAAMVLLRMVANSADARSWLGWCTPTAWPEHVRAFDENRWPVLLLPVAATLVLLLVSVTLREHRDTGAGVRGESPRRRSHRRGARSPLVFAWSSNAGVLAAWSAGLAAAGLVIGAMLPAIDEFLAQDDSFTAMLTAVGMDPRDLARGFIGMWAVIMGLVISVYIAFRIGAVRNEEATGRAEALLTRPLARWRWLGGHIAATMGAVLVLHATSGLALAATAAAMAAPVTFGEVMLATMNAVPVVLVFIGIAVLVYGLLPRITVVASATAAVVAYVLHLIGPLLGWPGWLLDVSPFHHLANVPLDPVDLSSAAVMCAIGLLLGVAGVAAFERRDLVGA